MKSNFSRRTAIKEGIGLVLAAGTVSSLARRAFADSAAAEVKVYTTDGTGRRHTLIKNNQPTPAGVLRHVTIDVVHPQQTILGFGAALTEAACTVLNRLAPNDRQALLDDLYSPVKNNFSTARLCIGASDYCTKVYSYDEGDTDPTLSRFSIDPDKPAVIPIVKQARAIRNDLFVFSSPWSPPGWMKYGGSMLGGSIKPHHLGIYAQYILKYLQAYQDAGISIDAMTIQNETDADQDGRMPACTWSEEIEAKYITEHLGPLLTKNNPSPQLWILDHNYDLAGRVVDQLSRPHLRQFIKAIAWHGYAGSVDQMSKLRQQYPELPMHWTEGGDLGASRLLQTSWANWSSVFADVLNNGASSITTWNLALDESGKPNTGPFDCRGMLTIDSKTNAVTRNGTFWGLCHYSRAFPRGSRILPTKTSAGIEAVAAHRPDGSLAVVLTNKDFAIPVEIASSDGKSSQVIVVPADSVTTVLL